MASDADGDGGCVRQGIEMSREVCLKSKNKPDVRWMCTVGFTMKDLCAADKFAIRRARGRWMVGVGTMNMGENKE